jgi:hypothetical protein
MKKLLTTLGLASILALEVAAQPVTFSGGGVRATNRPSDFAGNSVLYGFTNVDGSVSHRYGIVVATSTNAIHAVLSNLIANTGNTVTNVNTGYGIISVGTLYQPGLWIGTNTLILGSVTNLGAINLSNNIVLMRSNALQIASSTMVLSNIFSVRLMSPNAQGTFTNPPTGFGSIQWSNNVPYAVLADGTVTAMLSDGVGGAGSAVYIDTAHTNITAKGLTIMNSEDREVVTLSGTTPIIDATNSPSYYIELSGNTVATISNLTVGRFVELMVSNTTHTFSIAGAAMYINQNTTPSITTNGYTKYRIWRPATAVTNIEVLGRELELAFSGNVSGSTGATTLTIVGSINPSFNTARITNGLMLTCPFTNDTDSYLDTTHIGSTLDVSGSSSMQAVGMLSATVTNNITYSAPTFVLSGNSTQYAGNFAIGWNKIDMTNAVHVTGMVGVASANFGSGWMLTGRNLTSSNNTVSVSPSFQRAGTNFAVVAAGKRFRLSIIPDGSGGVNETNMLADIQVYDSP